MLSYIFWNLNSYTLVWYMIATIYGQLKYQNHMMNWRNHWHWQNMSSPSNSGWWEQSGFMNILCSTVDLSAKLHYDNFWLRKLTRINILCCHSNSHMPKSVFICRNDELPQETSSATCVNASMHTWHGIFVLNNQRLVALHRNK